jgi:hypothetical protein
VERDANLATCHQRPNLIQDLGQYRDPLSSCSIIPKSIQSR